MAYRDILQVKAKIHYYIMQRLHVSNNYSVDVFNSQIQPIIQYVYSMDLKFVNWKKLHSTVKRVHLFTQRSFLLLIFIHQIISDIVNQTDTQSKINSTMNCVQCRLKRLQMENQRQLKKPVFNLNVKGKVN